ncbi:MAG: ectoine/hydroxyectoine ABC transporter substrate-binding protein EhuB [Burkholderiales bacterium]
MNRVLVIVAALVAAAAVLLVAGHLAPTGEPPSRVFGRDVIRIGYAVEPPYAFLADDGGVTGESPEMARQIARRLGIARTQWVQTAFSDLIRDLVAGRIDVIAAGMFITPERATQVLFSDPTFRVRQDLLVRTGNPRNLHSYEDVVADRDARIAVISGAIEETVLLAEGLPRARLLSVPDALTGWVAVASGAVDGLALSSLSIRWMARASDRARVETAEPFAQPSNAVAGRLGYGAFAFRPGDVALRDAWNGVLHAFVGSEEHLRLVARFGFTAAELPGHVTAAEILAR